MAFYAGMGGAYSPVNRRWNYRGHKKPNEHWKKWKALGDLPAGPPKPPKAPGSGTGSSSWSKKNINPLTIEGMRNIGKAGNKVLRPYSNTKAYKNLSKKQKIAVDAAWAKIFADVYDQTIGNWTDTEWRNPWNIDYGPQWPMKKTNKHWRRKRKWR